MQIVLSDHNCEGHAEAIFFALRREGLLSLVPMVLRFFPDVGLLHEATDEQVWRLCQQEGYLLLTGNRRTVDEEMSLELVVRRLATATSLPVLTIGNLPRVLTDSDYCERCAERLAEIVLDLDDYRGVQRLYLPGPLLPP